MELSPMFKQDLFWQQTYAPIYSGVFQSCLSKIGLNQMACSRVMPACLDVGVGLRVTIFMPHSHSLSLINIFISMRLNYY